MTKKHRQALVLKAETAIASEHGMTVDQVNAAFDQHPIETNKDRYLRRQLARALFTLDELECIFRAKARAGDVAAGTLLVKINERRSSLLGLNNPPGFSVNACEGLGPGAASRRRGMGGRWKWGVLKRTSLRLPLALSAYCSLWIDINYQ